MQKLTAIATSIIDFINGTAVPLVFAVAFIVFLFGVFRYFILGAANPDKRKGGAQLIMYSIIGFAVMIVVWGLVNLIVATFGFDSNERPDLPTFAAPSSNGTSGSATGNAATSPGGGSLLSPATTQDSFVQQSNIETQGNSGQTSGPGSTGGGGFPQ